MKTRILTVLCVLAISLCSVHTTRAENELEAVADVIIVRPMSFAATVICSAVFVVALPIAAISKSVKQTAHVLVVKPARFTFTRPVGDFSDWSAD